MGGSNVVIFSVVFGVVIIFFSALLVAYIVKRRTQLRFMSNDHPPKFKPSYDTSLTDITDPTPDIRGTMTRPDVSPVTPTEFFTGDFTTPVHVQPSTKELKSRPSMGSSSANGEFGAIDPAMYEIENVDDTTESEDKPSLGQLKFSLLYDTFRNILRVTLISAYNLARPEADDSKHLNPYVTITLQPEYRHLLQSKVQQKNKNPQFNETFEFEVMFSNLYSQTLCFTVFNFLTGSRHTVIGQTVLPLEDLQPSDEQIFSLDLKPTTEKMQLGDILFSVGYLRIAGRLTLIVMKARNLPQVSVKGTDPYVKATLIQNGRRTKKKKTSAKKNKVNPVFNEAISFDIPNENLDTTGILLTVIHENKIIGCVLVAGNADGKELEHWNRMKISDKPVAEWHALQDGRKFY